MGGKRRSVILPTKDAQSQFGPDDGQFIRKRFCFKELCGQVYTVIIGITPKVSGLHGSQPLRSNCL